jgi:hypothetical protein
VARVVELEIVSSLVQRFVDRARRVHPEMAAALRSFAAADSAVFTILRWMANRTMRLLSGRGGRE